MDSDLKGRGRETRVSAAAAMNSDATHGVSRKDERIDDMLVVYEAERGPLPPVESSGAEIRRQCLRRLAEGLTLEDFRAAVRRAAGTPFLTGAGGRGWCASFDWLVANEENVRKVLSGRYEPPAQGAGAWAHGDRRPRAADVAAISGARAGMGPVASAVGARVKAATLERIRAREELLRNANDKEKAS